MNIKELYDKYPEKKFGFSINVRRDYKHIKEREEIDWSNNYQINNPIVDLGWKISLDHSCDEWVIGNVEETKKFISDLQSAINYCEQNI